MGLKTFMTRFQHFGGICGRVPVVWSAFSTIDKKSTSVVGFDKKICKVLTKCNEN